MDITDTGVTSRSGANDRSDFLLTCSPRTQNISILLCSIYHTTNMPEEIQVPGVRRYVPEGRLLARGDPKVLPVVDEAVLNVAVYLNKRRHLSYPNLSEIAGRLNATSALISSKEDDLLGSEVDYGSDSGD